MSTKQTQFDFSSNDSSNKFTLSATADSSCHAPPEYDNGEITITLTEDEMQKVRDLAEQRAESYKNGRTRDERSGGHHTTTSVHVQGLRAELAVAKAFGNGWEDVDKTISDNGDDGTDITLELDGKTRTVDVKSSSYYPAYIMKKAHASQYADAYMMVYDDDFRNNTELVITGWCTKDELVSEENKTPARGGDWMNYELQQYRDCPNPKYLH